MNLSGKNIGPYTVEAEIGRGGMGVVYRAVDERLDRVVAIKALPEELAGDAGRLERFEREAKVLASLNHPNVAGILGIEEQELPNGETGKYLVLEFVGGETLAEVLDRGPMAVDEAIEIAVQIAAGVEAAHEAGVIHRDLKPANIKVTPEGVAKVLDFGLAKADEGSMSGSGSGFSQSPTMTTPMSARSPTIEGAILGTAAYMSPEQARGRKVDKRTDIWSFGVVLYEMLVGASPFIGETATDSIGAVLHKGLDFGLLPKDTPAGVRRVLSRCVERDKSLRYRDIGDVRVELLRAGDESEQHGGVPVERSGLGVVRWVLLGVLGVVIGAGSWMSAGATRAVEPRVRFETDLVPGSGQQLGMELSPVRLSPDGQRLAYLSYLSDEDWVLCVRDLRTGEETVLRGAVEPEAPFWSPDGRYLAYFTGTVLERIAIAGGRSEVLAVVGLDRARSPGDWDERGRIVYSDYRGMIRLLEPNSNTPVEVIDPVPGRGGDVAVMPSFLPGGEYVLYFNQDTVSSGTGVYVGSLVDGTSKRLGSIDSTAQYIDPGWLMYWRAGEMHVHRFDLERLELVGDSEPVTGPAWRRIWPWMVSFSATRETLVYLPEEYDGDENGFFYHDLETGERAPLGPTGMLWYPRVSPDGTRVVFDRTTELTAGDIIVLDLERGIETPLTRDLSNESHPIWSPDGRWVYFNHGADLSRVLADGSGSSELVLSSPHMKQPTALSPDGGTLMYREQRDSLDILTVDLETGESVEWLASPFDEFDGDIDALGEWVVYTSSASGENRVMAARVSGDRMITPISGGFGRLPRWRGNRITYFSRTDLVSVEFTKNEGGEPVIGEPEVIMSIEGVTGVDAMPGGKRMLINRDLKPRRGGRLKIVKNWMPAERE